MDIIEKHYGTPKQPFKTYSASLSTYPARLDELFYLAERNPIQYHSEIAILVALFFLVVSGVRFTRSPLCFLPMLVNTELSLLFAEDKNVSAFHSRRIVALPSCAVDILEKYSIHIGNLVRILASSPLHNLELASQFQALVTPGLRREEQPIPYFCLLEDNRYVGVINKKKFRGGLSPTIDCRLKEFRPQLCQFLLEAGAPRHMVAFQMGHMKALRPAFSARNQLTPLEFAQYLQPFLNEYARILGWCNG